MDIVMYLNSVYILRAVRRYDMYYLVDYIDIHTNEINYNMSISLYELYKLNIQTYSIRNKRAVYSFTYDPTRSFYYEHPHLETLYYTKVAKITKDANDYIRLIHILNLIDGSINDPEKFLNDYPYITKVLIWKFITFAKMKNASRMERRMLALLESDKMSNYMVYDRTTDCFNINKRFINNME